MKALAVIGYILAGLSVIGGLVLSNNPNLPMEGFSALIAGLVTAFLFILPSAALIGIAQIRELLKGKAEK